MNNINYSTLEERIKHLEENISSEHSVLAERLLDYFISHAYTYKQIEALFSSLYVIKLDSRELVDGLNLKALQEELKDNELTTFLTSCFLGQGLSYDDLSSITRLCTLKAENIAFNKTLVE
ncbi:hypothetical protein SE116_11535 [Staphylococcus aureus]|uniref:hypothetical protein n=1 Tax=Staphylococcus aureus TaxID=1280 RepID=UPI0029C08514|nr:hypothetical protein [Staphylococcus aureus]WPF96938.1 hypothetical protein SE111_00995 [Staphylococcus aureus]WPF98900.1 hypothetical protein SE116_11535 [Staphylococcus aureus]